MRISCKNCFKTGALHRRNNNNIRKNNLLCTLPSHTVYARWAHSWPMFTSDQPRQLNNERGRVDRFVIPRDRLRDLQRRRSWLDTRSDHTNCNTWNTKYLREKKYANYLDDAFSIEPVITEASTTAYDGCEQAWPCIPRKKRYLSSADSILDLPLYSYAVFPELLDWSSDNILVAALGVNYHKWSWRSQSLINQGLTKNPIQCCKFDPRGELLALGTEAQMVEVHDTEQSKLVSYCVCKCSPVQDQRCSITAIDWSPTGNSFASGCSWGSVVSFGRGAQAVGWRRVCARALLAVRVSPDARYVAAAAFNCALLYLLTWPSLQLHSVLDVEWTVRTIAWHPWRSALLGVGTAAAGQRARVLLWKAAGARVQPGPCMAASRCLLDAMLFSRRSGELVLSLCEIDPQHNSKPHSRLVVLSGPERVVDQWGERRPGLDRVRTMVFSPDGTKLATATSDEDLIIWNFLPEDIVKKKMKYKNLCALPVYIDEANQGFSLR